MEKEKKRGERYAPLIVNSSYNAGEAQPWLSPIPET